MLEEKRIVFVSEPCLSETYKEIIPVSLK